MNKYRIVLIPKKNDRDGFYSITRKCEKISYKYLMSPKNAVPHITLLSFKIEEDMLDEIWKKINYIKNVLIVLEDIRFSEKHDFNFALIDVNKNEIMDVQQKVFDIVIQLKPIISDRMMGKFRPHFSLFGSKLSMKEMESYLDTSFLDNNKAFSFDIAIGTSQGFGEVKKILFE